MTLIDDDSFEKKILSLLADATNSKARKAGITREMRLQRDLGIDSIGLLGLIVRFEEAFGVDLSNVDLAMFAGNIRTVEDVLRVSREIVQAARARQ